MFFLFILVQDPFEYISFYGLRKHEKMLGKLVRYQIFLRDISNNTNMRIW